MIATEAIARLLLNMPPGFEIGGRFYWQAQELLGPNFMLLGRNDKKREEFTNALLDTMLKCHAMQYHLTNFKEHEKYFLEMIEKSGDGIFRSHKMLFEFEAFLFQLKSALDVGVKIIGILVPGRFQVRTFGSKGDHLIRGLEQYERGNSAKRELSKAIREMLLADREAWLEVAINLRDKIGHYKTFADFNYHAVNLGSQRTIRKPTFSGMTPVEYMETTSANCLEFLQDFICLSIGLALPRSFTISTNKLAPCSIGEPIASYIKFRLASVKSEV